MQPNAHHLNRSMATSGEAGRLDHILSTSCFDQIAVSDEDSAAMTIEFLRARLLSERSVSKAAKERSQQLMKKVAELESQLQFEIELRKRLEATRVNALSKYRSQLEGEYDRLVEPRSIGERCNGGDDKAAAFGRPMVDDLQGDRGQSKKSFNVVNESFKSSRLHSTGVALNNEIEIRDSSKHQNHLNDGEHVGSNDDDEHDQVVRENSMIGTHSNDGQHVGSNDDGEHNQEVREKGVLAWDKVKGVKKQANKDGLDWLGRSFSQRSAASGDAESPHKCWTGKSVRQLRKKESKVLWTNSEVAEVEASQAEYQHDLREKDMDVDRKMEMERIFEHQTKLTEHFAAEENAQQEWEQNFKEQSAVSIDGHSQNIENSMEGRHSMEQNRPQDGELEEDSTCNFKDSLSRPFLERQANMSAVDATPQSIGQSEATTGRKEVSGANSLGIDDNALSQLDLPSKSCNTDILEEDEVQSKAQKLDDKQKMLFEKSMNLRISSDSQAAADFKNIEQPSQTNTASSGDTSNPCLSRRSEVGTSILLQQNGKKGGERTQLSWGGEALDVKDLKNSLQTMTSKFGGSSNANVLSTPQEGMGLHAQYPAAQQRARTHSWGGEALDGRSSQGFSHNLSRDFSSDESFQREVRAKDGGQKHDYGAYGRVSAPPELVEAQWYRQSVSTRLGTFPPFPDYRKFPRSTESPAYANGHDGAAFISHHKSVSGGFDKVADVLHILQIAKHEIEKGGSHLLDAACKGGSNGRGASYDEPHYPSVDPTIQSVDNDAYSATFPSRGPEKRYGADYASWKEPWSYFTGASKQGVTCESNRSRTAYEHYCPPPEYGYDVRFHGGEQRNHK